VDISPVTTSYTPEDNSWIASAHGTDATETVTLDGAVGFVPATHFPTGVLPSGTAVAKVTATGKYGLFDNAAVDGPHRLRRLHCRQRRHQRDPSPSAQPS